MNSTSAHAGDGIKAVIKSRLSFVLLSGLCAPARRPLECKAGVREESAGESFLLHPEETHVT